MVAKEAKKELGRRDALGDLEQQLAVRGCELPSHPLASSCPESFSSHFLPGGVIMRVCAGEVVAGGLQRVCDAFLRRQGAVPTVFLGGTRQLRHAEILAALTQVGPVHKLNLVSKPDNLLE
eukprot:260785-Rhodomonas_salina.1